MGILKSLASKSGIFKDRMKSPMHNAADGLLRLSRGMVKVKPSEMIPDKNGKMIRKGAEINFTKKGKSLIMGAGLISSAYEGVASLQESRMGTFSNELSTPTPSYLNNGGATGDLAFALHQNRKGWCVLLGVVGKALGKKGLGIGALTNIGFGIYSFGDEYATSRAEGNGRIVSGARGAAEAIIPTVLGWKYLPFALAMNAPKMVMAGGEMVGRIARANEKARRLNAFNNASFNDTEQAYTMRQAGMAIAQRSRYNTQAAMLGNEAKYMAK